MKREAWRKSGKKKRLKYKTNEEYREKVKNQVISYWHKNREKCLADHALWYQKNKDKLLTKLKTESLILRLSLILKLGDKCVHCSNDDVDVLEFDHIIPLHSKKRKYGNILREVKSHPELFQLLCANCHRKKTLEDIKEYMERRK
jgi:5-methylcytosine-specific restriction endonuclease McrA